MWGGLLRSPRRKGRLGPRAFSRSICLNTLFGAPCFKLPLGRAGASARRAAQGGRHGGAARGGWPARAGGALCAVAAGLSRERGAGVGALSTKHLRSGAGRQLLCNLSPSRTGAVSLRRRRGLHLGRRGRRQRPKAVALVPGTCRAPSPLPSLPLNPCAGRPRLACRGRGAGSGAAHLAPAGLRAAWGGVCESSSAEGGGGEAGASDRWSLGLSQFLAGVSRLLQRGLAFSDFPSNLALLPLPLSPLPSTPSQVQGFCNAVGVVT